MFMIHNGHLPDATWKLLRPLMPDDVPVLALAPHVAQKPMAKAVVAKETVERGGKLP